MCGVWTTCSVALLFAACGHEPAPTPTVPAWAHVAPEQIAEARKHGVPVAFENDLGVRFRPEPRSDPREPISLDGDRQPVVQVSQPGARELAAWVSTRSEGRVRTCDLRVAVR